MNYVFLRYVFLGNCDFMSRKKEKRKIGRKPKKTTIGVKIPQDCFKCIWKENKTTIEKAKIKCNNKDAIVLQENDEWVCYSFATHISNNEKKINGKRR